MWGGYETGGKQKCLEIIVGGYLRNAEYKRSTRFFAENTTLQKKLRLGSRLGKHICKKEGLRMTICDMCGRELEGVYSTYTFDTTDTDGSFKEDEFDVCEDCDKEIYKFILSKSGRRWGYDD